VYAIFEGGGAKAITHIGALKALEMENLRIAGAAGSSAGAIIAALAAFGYTADEIFAADGSAHILEPEGKTPIDLIGRWSWRRYKMLPIIFGTAVLFWLIAVTGVHIWFAPLGFIGTALLLALFPYRSRSWKKTGVVVGLLLSLAALWLFVGEPQSHLRPVQVSLVAFLLGVAAFAMGAWPIVWRRGLFSTTAMSDILNTLLRNKLIEHYAKLGRDPRDVPRLVRFKHLATHGCVPLKVIVTDARAGRMLMFGPEDGEVVVADAVAASAAIPFVFRSPLIEGAPRDHYPIYVDGGLVSNLPAWSLRTEKRALERQSGLNGIDVLAFTLRTPSELSTPPVHGRRPPPLPNIFRYLRTILWTGIYGSQQIVEDFVSDLMVIDLPSPLGTLAFGCAREEAAEAYACGLRDAKNALAERRLIRDATQRALRQVLETAEQLIQKRRETAGKDMPSLRINLIDPVLVGDRNVAFRIVASDRMGEDSDDRLELDPRNLGAPTAFDKNHELLLTLKGMGPRDLMMTKYEHALIPKRIETAICIPVKSPYLEGAPPERILCIDSTDCLQDDYNDPSFRSTLRDVSILTLRTPIWDAARAVLATQE
jgi:NTE family protein